MIFGTPGSAANMPSKLSNFYGVGFLNYCQVNDPRCNEIIKAVDELGWDFYRDYAKFCAIMKPIYPYILEECWQIPLPGRYYSRFWQPWLKDYHGEGGIGYLNVVNYLSYIWLDQDLKEEMTGKR